LRSVAEHLDENIVIEMHKNADICGGNTENIQFYGETNAGSARGDAAFYGAMRRSSEEAFSRSEEISLA